MPLWPYPGGKNRFGGKSNHARLYPIARGQSSALRRTGVVKSIGLLAFTATTLGSIRCG
jgi:hypothetical protein